MIIAPSFENNVVIRALMLLHVVAGRFSPLGPLGIVFPIHPIIDLSLTGSDGLFTRSEDFFTDNLWTRFFLGINRPPPFGRLKFPNFKINTAMLHSQVLALCEHITEMPPGQKTRPLIFKLRHYQKVVAEIAKRVATGDLLNGFFHRQGSQGSRRQSHPASLRESLRGGIKESRWDMIVSCSSC